MDNIITIDFAFLEDIYYFMAHYKIKDELKGYQVNVMEVDLEVILYGDHVIKERNGYLQIEIFGTSERERLKLKIVEALKDFLKVPYAKF